MKIRSIICFIISAVSALAVSAQSWSVDTLGGDFRMRYVDHADDYSGQVRSTIIRLTADSVVSNGRGVLYVHGFNDYFFQEELARKFTGNGYDFYAVDLRKYGRSLMPGQKHCQVRNLDEYFPDIDSALVDMRRYGCREIVLMGHSTGGLVASYYMERNPEAPVNALVLNSPFLDWNLGKMECCINLVSAIGRLFPGIKVSQGISNAYSLSLLKSEHGEWEYHTGWKSQEPVPVDLGWVRAINKAQHYLRSHKYAIKVPILLMYSSRSIDATDWVPEANSADAVLDVEDIKKYGRLLGHDITMVSVNGGLHDLILSAPDVRYPLYDYIFNWLRLTLGS